MTAFPDSNFYVCCDVIITDNYQREAIGKPLILKTNKNLKSWTF